MTETGGPRLVERSIDILMALSDGPQTFTAVCRTVGLSKATVHRILSGLGYLDFVVHNSETGEYMLGPGSYRMARRFRDEDGGIASLVRSAISDLWKEMQETVILHVRLGSRRVVIEELESPRPLRYAAGVGSSAPLHVGAAGKVLLAWLDEDQLRRTIPGELAPLTDSTISDWDQLLEELHTVRSQGWAESHGERVPGAFAISAPIFDDPGHVVACVSVLGPDVGLTRARFTELRRALRSTAAQASALVGLQAADATEPGDASPG